MRSKLTLMLVVTGLFVSTAASPAFADPGSNATRKQQPMLAAESGGVDVPGLGIENGREGSVLAPSSLDRSHLGIDKRIQGTLWPVPEDSGEGRRIVYHVTAQRVWLIESDGSVVTTYLVSGRRNTPRPGTYDVFSKSLKAYATHDGITMRYMVRFTRASSGVPIGFHDLPRDKRGRPLQSVSQLGTYRSGGCVRQTRADAIFLYGWAPVGTTVVVLP